MTGAPNDRQRSLGIGSGNMNICTIGHGMMGVWHSEALVADARYSLVGRRAEPTAEFAARYGYRRWTIDLEEALADPKVDAVIVANPSVVEVFVNGRQCVAVRVYPGRPDSTGISLISRGQESEVLSLDCWQMRSIYESS